MSDRQEPTASAPATDPFGFLAAMNRHGYSFHYRTIKECMDQFHARQSDWRMMAVEFPVQVRGRDTRIDYLLKLTESRQLVPFRDCYLIIECKRSNPAF